MTLIVRWVGRFLLFGVFIAQAGVFAYYSSVYLQKKLGGLIFLLVLPAVATWIFVMKCKRIQLNWQWLVWLLYLCLLIPMVCLLARSDVTKKLDKENFFGPNFLKVTFCGAPVVAVLLLVTAKDSNKYGAFVAHLCGSIALDLFDELELLELLLLQDHPLYFSADIERSIIAFVCISFFLTVFEMAENKFEGDDDSRPNLHSYKAYICRLAFQILFVNIPLLVIRLVVHDKYKVDASVFTVKNVIIIVTSVLEIIRACGRD